MSEEEIIKLTEEYNEKRDSLPFPTTPVSVSGVKSILNLYPEIEEADPKDRIQMVGRVIYDIAFG